MRVKTEGVSFGGELMGVRRIVVDGEAMGSMKMATGHLAILVKIEDVAEEEIGAAVAGAEVERVGEGEELKGKKASRQIFSAKRTFRRCRAVSHHWSLLPRQGEISRAGQTRQRKLQQIPSEDRMGDLWQYITAQKGRFPGCKHGIVTISV